MTIDKHGLRKRGEKKSGKESEEFEASVTNLFNFPAEWIDEYNSIMILTVTGLLCVCVCACACWIGRSYRVVHRETLAFCGFNS